MISALREMIVDNWVWRDQIWRLAVTELQKQVRGTVLGWVWLILSPIIYVSVFWFALEIGLRSGSPVAGVPFLVWLTTGLFPWFFMSSMLGQGSNLYKRYGYLINKLRFPISVISSFFTMAQFIIFLLTLVVVLIVMGITRTSLTIYALQVPFLAIIMFVFWALWSMMTSPLSALSKDFHNIIRAMNTPLFWVSGTIFSVSHIHVAWIRWVLSFNPINFFVTGFRAALCEHFWIWEQPRTIYPFIGVFVLFLIGALRVQARLGSEVADVL